MINSTFKIVFIIEVVAITAIRSYYTLGKEPKSIKLSLRSRVESLFMFFEVIGMLIPLVYVFTPILDFANYIIPQWVGWLGSAIFVCAILLLWQAHHDLGKFWISSLSITKDHKLIKNGIYSYIRHPLYASHIIWAIAQVLMLSNWIAGYSFIIVFLPHYFYRVGKEERMMLNEFGEEYTSYKKETGRLFPRINR